MNTASANRGDTGNLSSVALSGARSGDSSRSNWAVGGVSENPRSRHSDAKAKLASNVIADRHERRRAFTRARSTRG